MVRGAGGRDRLQEEQHAAREVLVGVFVQADAPARSSTCTSVAKVPCVPGLAPWRLMMSARSPRCAATGVPGNSGSSASCARGTASVAGAGARSADASRRSQSRSLTSVTSARPRAEQHDARLVREADLTEVVLQQQEPTLAAARAARSDGKLAVLRVARWSSAPSGALSPSDIARHSSRCVHAGGTRHQGFPSTWQRRVAQVGADGENSGRPTP